MHKHSRFAAAFGCVATLAMAGCATTGGLTPQSGISQQARTNAFSGPGWIEKDGVLYHVPHYMMSRQMASHQRIRPNTQLTYADGPVLVAPKAYLILWGYQKYHDPDKVAKLLESYLTNVGGSLHNNIYTQYYMISGSQTTYITNPTDQLGGVWDDETDSVPNSPSDAQVAAEALNGVAKFGYDPNGSYIVATPHRHSSPGFGNFCGYHSSTSYESQYVSYTNLPYMPDGGHNCGANQISPPSDERGVDEGVTIIQAHEYGESITDPVPNTGWTADGGYYEIGDLCIWIDIANEPFNTKSYTMQPMFSNATSTCVQSYGSP
jgi:hypothetical protein